MSIPAFTAERSIYTGGGHYQARWSSGRGSNEVIPARPACRNCDWILGNCARNGWRPRAVCNACYFGNCYNEPEIADPYPDPFPPPRL